MNQPMVYAKETGKQTDPDKAETTYEPNCVALTQTTKEEKL